MIPDLRDAAGFMAETNGDQIKPSVSGVGVGSVNVSVLVVVQGSNMVCPGSC